jgi:hypothetical protein
MHVVLAFEEQQKSWGLKVAMSFFLSAFAIAVSTVALTQKEQ